MAEGQNNIISKIQYKDTDISFTQDYDIGTFFDKVFYRSNNTNYNYSLRDFYETMVDFFNKGVFEYYSTNEPTSNNVKVWYQIKS